MAPFQHRWDATSTFNDYGLRYHEEAPVVVVVARDSAGNASGSGVSPGVLRLLCGLCNLRVPAEVGPHQQLRLPHARQYTVGGSARTLTIRSQSSNHSTDEFRAICIEVNMCTSSVARLHTLSD